MNAPTIPHYFFNLFRCSTEYDKKKIRHIQDIAPNLSCIFTHVCSTMMLKLPFFCSNSLLFLWIFPKSRAPDFSVPKLLPDLRMKEIDICTFGNSQSTKTNAFRGWWLQNDWTLNRLELPNQLNYGHPFSLFPWVP